MWLRSLTGEVRLRTSRVSKTLLLQREEKKHVTHSTDQLALVWKELWDGKIVPEDTLVKSFFVLCFRSSRAVWTFVTRTEAVKYFWFVYRSCLRTGITTVPVPALTDGLCLWLRHVSVCTLCLKVDLNMDLKSTQTINHYRASNRWSSRCLLPCPHIKYEWVYWMAFTGFVRRSTFASLFWLKIHRRSETKFNSHHETQQRRAAKFQLSTRSTR